MQMDEQHLILETPNSFCNFFSRILHRFENGNAPFDGEDQLIGNFSFPFDSHPGPISDAITDANGLRRTLFLFIYCKENPLTNKIISIFKKDEISREIRKNYIFLPLDITHPEGWSTATALDFYSVPIIALVRPNGTTLSESQIFFKNQGQISSIDLLSSLRIENHERNSDAEIIHEQDHEFQNAVLQDQENERKEAEVEQQAQIDKKSEEMRKQKIDDDFANLPEPTEDSSTIRFHFPDNINRVHVFPRDGPIELLFVFVRKYMYPKSFSLRTGFPQFVINESEEPLRSLCPNKQFIVYVDEE
ncbi:FAS-associated factor 2 [Histomonas meleagridis]|uniref:FAS-associated factor 2 n=1 Tax=Histomonas meleagridis TaxID=135588 RepID=UPI00355ABFE8|nr:FAS-associated factor 2 [Histomonas meleagridis]KAH0799128.1 FAS-associated factor 2 [Histomonas meleagridis]